MKNKLQLLSAILLLGLVFNTSVFGQSEILKEIQNYADVETKKGNKVTTEGIEKLFKTNTEGDITFGTEEQYNNNSDANTNNVCVLDETHFVVVFTDVANSSYGTAILGIISGTTISYGKESIFLSSTMHYPDVAKLDATHFVIAFENTDSDCGSTVIGTYNSMSKVPLSFSATETFNSGTTGLVSVSAIDATHFVVVFTDVANSSYGTSVLGTIDEGDGSVGFGAESVFNSGSISFPSVTVLDATHFVVAYKDESTIDLDNGIDMPGTGIVGTIDGSGNIAFGSKVIFHKNITFRTKVSTLDANNVVIAYLDANTASAYSIIGTIASNVITYGSEYFLVGQANYLGLTTLNSSAFVVVGSIDEVGTAYTGKITNGNEITYSSGVVYYTDITKYSNEVACFGNVSGDAKFVVVYEQNNLGVGSKIGTVEGIVTPVELTNFTASTSSATVVLNWTTATEVNNYGFEIQCNTNLRGLSNLEGFTTIGFVEGHGNSNSPKEYSFVDTSTPLSASSVNYRLKQIDIDGAFEYSDVVTVELTNSMEYKLTQNHPNPFNPSTQIAFTIPSAGVVKLNIYNVLGEVVFQLVNENLEAGFHQYQFNANNLTSGIYFYSISVNGFTEVKKMNLIK